MTTFLSLLAEAETWLGVEPLGEAQWAEVAELRERVRAALHPVVEESPADPRDLRAVSAEFLAEIARKREKEGGA